MGKADNIATIVENHPGLPPVMREWVKNVNDAITQDSASGWVTTTTTTSTTTTTTTA